MSGRKNLFPVMHESVGKSGRVFFVCGSPFDLKNDVKLEVIAKESQFKKGE